MVLIREIPYYSSIGDRLRGISDKDAQARIGIPDDSFLFH